MPKGQLKPPAISSSMAESLIPSEIIRINNEINQKRKEGKSIFNLTIGDFDPSFFPIPSVLEDLIVQAYRDKKTNYPPAHGEEVLRDAVSILLGRLMDLPIYKDDILIAGGSRPLIYAAYLTILDPGDRVIYAVPSWNNNHYCHLVGAEKIEIEVTPEKNFMPVAEDIKPFLQEANLLALCSPQNPTGTVFTRDVLLEICQLVLEENRHREGIRKPLYILYDQMYWQLTFGETIHHHPVELFPELSPYTIYIDGLSKAYAGTGVRVGWAFGPGVILSRMRAILSHIGAWAPRPEQIAVGRFLTMQDALSDFMQNFKREIEFRLVELYRGFFNLKSQGYPIDIIPPKAAIYMTVRFPWKGRKTFTGQMLNQQSDVTSYILEECHIAVVPFYAFGSSPESDWYRVSVGTLDKKDIETIIQNIKQGMDQLK